MEIRESIWLAVMDPPPPPPDPPDPPDPPEELLLESEPVDAEELDDDAEAALPASLIETVSEASVLEVVEASFDADADELWFDKEGVSKVVPERAAGTALKLIMICLLNFWRGPAELIGRARAKTAVFFL